MFVIQGRKFVIDSKQVFACTMFNGELCQIQVVVSCLILTLITFFYCISYGAI